MVDFRKIWHRSPFLDAYETKFTIQESVTIEFMNEILKSGQINSFTVHVLERLKAELQGVIDKVIDEGIDV